MMPEYRPSLDVAAAEKKLHEFLSLVLRTSGLRLQFDLQIREAATSSRDAQSPAIEVFFEGPDTPLLVQRRGELLLALEHLATQVLQLEPQDHERVSFDAADFKFQRVTSLRSLVERAGEAIQRTNRPYSFPPMNSRERRMLHLELERVGLQSKSQGQAHERFVTAFSAKVQLGSHS